MLTTATVLHIRNFGSLVKTEFVLRLEAIRDESDKILQVGQRYAKKMNVLEVEGTPGSAEYVQFTYDVILKDKVEAEDMLKEMQAIPGIKNVKFIASRYDVDY